MMILCSLPHCLLCTGEGLAMPGRSRAKISTAEGLTVGTLQASADVTGISRGNATPAGACVTAAGIQEDVSPA